MPFVLLVFRLPLNMSGQKQRRIVVSFPIAGPQIYGAADLAGDSLEGFLRIFKKKFRSRAGLQTPHRLHSEFQ